MQTLRTEMVNRMKGFEAQESELHSRLRGGGSAPTAPHGNAPVGGPVKITNDADYNALSPGAEFIAPDGSHRRKP